MAKVLNCDFEVSESELKLRYYVPFWTNTLGKGIKPLYTTSAMGQIVPLLFFYKDSLGIK